VEYYPAFLNLKGRKAVVVGGGKVAERKVLMLLQSGAVVTVISPFLTKRLCAEKSRQTIRHLARGYRSNDLKGAFIVVAATDSPEINCAVGRDAPALVNVVDMPAECNFIAPSVVKRGGLTIAISTGGISPALSKTLRKELERLYSSRFSDYLGFVKKIRGKAMTEIDDRKKRETFLKGLGSEKMLSLLRREGLTAVRNETEKRLAKSCGSREGKEKERAPGP
jgi:precorrin-2 dehydrogenase/sirohydrochlorin ferrochelatase